MIDFSKEEVLTLAQMSSLQLNDDEVNWLREQLAKTIEYTKELDQFISCEEHDAVKTINVFREDKARKKESALLLAEAPETKETYFVVPKILDK